VEEKESAKSKYDSAVNLGNAAGLVQRDSRNANQVKKRFDENLVLVNHNYKKKYHKKFVMYNKLGHKFLIEVTGEGQGCP